MRIHSFCFMAFFLSISSKLPRVICCVNCSFNCYAVGLYRRKIRSQKLEVAVVIYDELNEEEPKQVKRLMSGPKRYRYTVAETGAMKCIKTLSLKISLECPPMEKKEIKVKLHPDQLMNGMVVDDFEGIDMESPGSITMFIHDAKKQRLWELQIDENLDEPMPNEPRIEELNAEATDVKWISVSKVHETKFKALVENLKTNPNYSTRVGACRIVRDRMFRIGRGSSGTEVFIGLNDDGREVAVKCLSPSLFKDLGENEIKILMARPILREPHIVKYLYSQLGEETGYIILDLCEKTLEIYVESHTEEELKDEGPRIMTQILLGLETLHGNTERPILHLDLKPSNILVDTANDFFLSDFGISRSLLRNQQTLYTAPKGTSGWMATESLPERVCQHSVVYKTKSDIQVAGMLFFYILTKGEHPFGPTWVEQNQNIKNGEPVNLDNMVDPGAKDLVSWMLQKNPDDRPSSKECLKHPFLRSSDEVFDLITCVGNEVEIKSKDLLSSVVQNISCDPSVSLLWHPEPNWQEKIDPQVLSYISKTRKYTNDVTDLLRFIRNTDIHWCDHEVPATIFCIVGQPKQYFLELFPTLPVILHKIIRNDQDWKRRDRLCEHF